MTTLTPDSHAHAVRNEMASLALVVHRLANDAGGDLTAALAAQSEIVVRAVATRRALLELPPVTETPPPLTERATSASGEPLWQHACGLVLHTRLDEHAACTTPAGEWRPLYVRDY